MNRLLISDQPPQHPDPKTFPIELAQASNMLPMLRNDHFVHCEINVTGDINNAQLRFCMHLGRVLADEGVIVVKGTQGSLAKIKPVIKNLGLFVKNEGDEKFEVTKKQQKQKEVERKEIKLAIGFKNLADDTIDEDELMKNEKINLNKQTGGSCAQKPRACANCNCGRKDTEQPLPSKQQLVKSINEGKPVSGCGKCYLGDSFRCGSCPYAGLPAFKPGDKLKLVDDTKVVIENSSTTTVNNGKVKIEL